MSLPETIEDTGFTIHAMEEPPSSVEQRATGPVSGETGDKEPTRGSIPFPNVVIQEEAGAVSECGWYYSCLENETCHIIGKKFDCDAQKLLSLNCDKYPGLNLKAKLYELTVLKLPKQIKTLMNLSEKKPIVSSQSKKKKTLKAAVFLTPYRDEPWLVGCVAVQSTGPCDHG